jgi:LuxR family maltose regulon positive regulatory protein
MTQPAARLVAAGRRGVHVSRSSARPRLVGAKTRPPPVAASVVDRPRLYARLDLGATRRVTFVGGAAGSGKTTLVASWLASAGGGRVPRDSTVDTLAGADSVAWVSLDADDRDPVLLWTYVLRALRQLPTLAGSPPASMPAPTTVDGAYLTDLAAALEGLPRRTVLVFDDVHRLGPAGPALDSLLRILRMAIPRLSTVLCSRTGCPPGLAWARLAGDMVEIPGSDLACTPAEVAELMLHSGLSPDGSEVNDIIHNGQGWIGGLSLALARVDGQGGGSVAAALSARHGPLAEYLEAEVLSAQEPWLRDFLTSTGVAPVLTGELAGDLSGRADGAAVLDRLRHDNLFLTEEAGGDSRSYRYSPLFRDFLVCRARVEAPSEYAASCVRAADWYARAGRPALAAQVAAEAGDWSRVAAAAVGGAAVDTWGPDGPALDQVWRLLPRPAFGDGVALAAAQAFAAALRGDAAVAGECVRVVRDSLGSRDQLGSRDRLDGRDRLDHGGPDGAARTDQAFASHALLDLVSLLLTRSGGDHMAAAEVAREVLDQLDHSRACLLPWAPRLRTVAEVHLGVARMWTDGVADPLRDAAVSARQTGLVRSELDAAGHRALLLALRGQALAALELVDEVEARARDVIGGPGARTAATGAAGAPTAVPSAGPSTGCARVARALAYRLMDEPDRVRVPELDAVVTDGEPADGLAAALVRAGAYRSAGDLAAAATVLSGCRDRTPPRLLRDWHTIEEAELAIAAGHPDRALREVTPLAGRDPTGPAGPNARDPYPLAALARITAARAQLALGAPAQARSLLAGLCGGDPDPGPLGRTEAWLLEALAADRLGHEGAVRIALGAALAAAGPQRLRRPFADGGPPVRALLRRHHDLSAEHPFHLEVCPQETVGRSGAEEPERFGLVEPITERESVVLRYLPTLLTTGDIARELSVSPNTVKTHLKSLYRKLAVGSRRDAVHRARRLSLL